MEKKRAQDEKQDKSARKIQKLWNRHKTRKGSRIDLRVAFDKIVEVDRDRSLPVNSLSRSDTLIENKLRKYSKCRNCS